LVALSVESNSRVRQPSAGELGWTVNGLVGSKKLALPVTGTSMPQFSVRIGLQPERYAHIKGRSARSVRRIGTFRVWLLDRSAGSHQFVNCPF
jgi:hypothetical protein